MLLLCSKCVVETVQETCTVNLGQSEFLPKLYKTCDTNDFQGRNKVRWHPEQEASLAPPFSNLRSFGSKYTVSKKVLSTLLGLFCAHNS